VEDFRPKIDFDDPSLTKKANAKSTLEYATPRSDPPRRWRPSRLFTWAAASSAMINLALYCWILFSGNNSRDPLWFLYAIANLPALPLMLWFVSVCERAGIDPAAFDWFYAILLGGVGAVLWGLIAIVVATFLRACLAVAVWLFGDAW
jgi:hypothetical protein